MNLCDLPDFLPTTPAANVTDPDGEIERAAVALALAGDTIGAAGLVLTIRSDVRRQAWLQHFRPATIAAGMLANVSIRPAYDRPAVT